MSKAAMLMELEVTLVRPLAENVMECELPGVAPLMLRLPKEDAPDASVATGVVPFSVPGVPLSAAPIDIPAVLTKLFCASATRTTTVKVEPLLTVPGG